MVRKKTAGMAKNKDSTTSPTTSRIGPWEMLNLDSRADLLEAIFRNCDLKHLKELRLVCRLWNIEALRVFETKAKIKVPKEADLTKLQKVLQSCNLPNFYFTSLELDSSCGVRDTMKHILFDYGSYLKSFKSVGELRRENGDGYNLAYNEIYTSILTKWCQNLEEIRILTESQVTGSCVEFEKLKSVECNSVFKLPTSMQLKLSTVELDGNMISTRADYCISLLLQLPNLSRLKIRFGVDYRKTSNVRNSDIMPFFLALRDHPKITRRLQEFTIFGLKVVGLTSLLSELEFSPDYLQVLGVSGATNISDPEFGLFTSFLEKLSDYPKLQKLTIYKCTCHKCEWRHWKTQMYWMDIEQSIPVIKSLRHLKICSNGSYGIASLSLLMKFPNLEKLELIQCDFGHENPNYHRSNTVNYVDFDYFFDSWSWLRMTEFGRTIMENCSGIKHLTIDHFVAKNSSFQCIQECFQNLEYLKASLRSNVKYCWEVFMECKVSIPTALEHLTKLPKLYELAVTINHDVLYANQELWRGFKVLTNFNGLRHFSVKLESPKTITNDKRLENFWSDVVLNNDGYNSRTLTITAMGFCICNIFNSQLEDWTKVLDCFKGDYRLNWCCDTNIRTLSRIKNICHISSFPPE